MSSNGCIFFERDKAMQVMAQKGSKGQKILVHLKAGDKIHFIGISGVAMAGAAGVLKAKGFDVQGSDKNYYPPMSEQLKAMHIPLLDGYSENHIESSLKLVVVGNSISAKNIEAQALMRSGIPYLSLPEFIRFVLIGEKQSLVVSGTHGKTTTSSMMAFLAEACGKSPSFLIGGIPNNFNQSFKYTESSCFVIEGDEYDTAYFDKRPKFIHYQPFSVILTSIEFDHADIYDHLDKVKNSFEMLVRSLPQDGLLIANCEDKNILDILSKSSSKNVITYGVTCGDYRLEKRIPFVKGGVQEFWIKTPQKETVKINLRLFGLHNAMNALGAFALSSELSWPREKIIQGLNDFEGVRRRFQILFESSENVLVEDFAHHPTAVKAVIGALKERYPRHAILAVFEPRSASSRRNVFQKQYASALSQADQVFTAPPFKEFEIPEDQRFSSENLVKDLKAQGVSAFYCSDIDKMVQKISQSLDKKSVIVVMSNGPFGGIHQKIKNILETL